LSRLNSTEAGHSTLEVARLLLAHGADPNAGYLHDGNTPPVTALSGAFRGRRDPLRQPAHQHSLPLARLLLDAGADPNDEQALRNVCGHPHEDTGLALLLEHGLGRRSNGPWPARIEHIHGRRLPTPARLVQDELRYAAICNLSNRVRLLLHRCAETGIDIDAPAGVANDPCQTAYEFAVVCGNTEIVGLLTQAGAKAAPLSPPHQLFAACLRADRPAVHRLMDADPGLFEWFINTRWWPEPLHQAVALDRPEAVALLVSLGLPINEDSLGGGRRCTPPPYSAISTSCDSSSNSAPIPLSSAPTKHPTSSFHTTARPWAGPEPSTNMRWPPTSPASHRPDPLASSDT
jgi:hypothetical protein